ncbi:MAG: hypothetical protein ACK5LZ_04885 [Anaerorhabdus sp.]
MKKTIKSLLFLIIAMFFATNVYAGTTILFWHSDGTYVKSTHGDSYFAYVYDGEAAVRGSDRIGGAGFRWTRITYDVQGTRYFATAWASNANDTVSRRAYVRAEDKWNNGQATRAWYSYELYGVSSQSPTKP